MNRASVVTVEYLRLQNADTVRRRSNVMLRCKYICKYTTAIALGSKMNLLDFEVKRSKGQKVKITTKHRIGNQICNFPSKAYHRIHRSTVRCGRSSRLFCCVGDAARLIRYVDVCTYDSTYDSLDWSAV